MISYETQTYQLGNLLAPSTNVSVQQKCNEEVAPFYSDFENICYCSDIETLTSRLNIPYVTQEWRLFIGGGTAEQWKQVCVSTNSTFI